MAFEGFDHGNDAIVAADPKVVALGNIVGQNYARGLADSRKDGEQDATF
jgi:hypothetical protein